MKERVASGSDDSQTAFFKISKPAGLPLNELQFSVEALVMPLFLVNLHMAAISPLRL
jgi:hypothetical protein